MPFCPSAVPVHDDRDMLRKSCWVYVTHAKPYKLRDDENSFRYRDYHIGGNFSRWIETKRGAAGSPFQDGFSDPVQISMISFSLAARI